MLRRTFIQKMAFAVSTLGLASLPYAVARLLAPGEKTNFSQHLRPPGALENDDAFVVCVVKFARQNVLNLIIEPVVNVSIRLILIQNLRLVFCVISACRCAQLKRSLLFLVMKLEWVWHK